MRTTKINKAVIRNSKKVVGTYTLYINGVSVGRKVTIQEAIDYASGRSVSFENIKLPRGAKVYDESI